MGGVDDQVDLRRRFDQWSRDLSFCEYRRSLRAVPVGVLDAVYGDELAVLRPRPWLR